MPIEITKYACEKCGAEYDNHDEALTCEALLTHQDPQEYEVGEKVQIYVEENDLGVRWSDGQMAGVILHKSLSYVNNEEGSHHMHYYTVGIPSYHGQFTVRGAVWGKDGSGDTFASPHDMNHALMPEHAMRNYCSDLGVEWPEFFNKKE